jgi:hypothetical protein
MGLRRALGSIAKPKPDVDLSRANEFVIWFSNPPHKHSLWIWREGPDGFFNLMALFDDNRDHNLVTFRRPMHIDGLSAALAFTGFDFSDCHLEDFTGIGEIVEIRDTILAGDVEKLRPWATGNGEAIQSREIKPS